MAELNENGALKFPEIDPSIELTKDDLLISEQAEPGYVTNTNGNVTVVMDTNLTPALLEEGFVRELISKIQTMRKEAGFEVMDRISVGFAGNDRIKEIFNANKDTISHEVLADSLEEGELSGYTKEWNINGEKVSLTVKKN